MSNELFLIVIGISSILILLGGMLATVGDWFQRSSDEHAELEYREISKAGRKRTDSVVRDYMTEQGNKLADAARSASQHREDHAQEH